MSLHYILDGYNIVHQMSMNLNDDIDIQRRQLVSFIETKRPQGSLQNEVTIFFDGGPGLNGRIQDSIVKVYFSGDVSADDRIKQMVEDASNKKQIIVVTDDREIKYAVSASGSKSISVKKFLSMGRIAGKAVSRRSKSETNKVKAGFSPSKRISKGVETKINEELKKVWLKS